MTRHLLIAAALSLSVPALAQTAASTGMPAPAPPPATSNTVSVQTGTTVQTSGPAKTENAREAAAYSAETKAPNGDGHGNAPVTVDGPEAPHL